MRTLLERPAIVTGTHRIRADARKMADAACREAIERAGLKPGDIDLLLNCGLYHDRALGEPALAALIQQDVGINPEDPHEEGHGSFSFDVANGGCGVLTCLQVADGYLRAGTIEHALVVASDANPGHGLASGFPFDPYAAAVVCSSGETGLGVAGFGWANEPDDALESRARVVFEGSRNVLRVEQAADFASKAAVLAGKAVTALLADHELRADEIDLVVANPLCEGFSSGLAAHTGIDVDRIVLLAGAEQVHTAAVLVALGAAEDGGRVAAAQRMLLVSAGTGTIVGVALFVR